MRVSLILGCLAMIAPLAVAQKGGQSYGVARMEAMGRPSSVQGTVLTAAPPNLCPVGVQAKHLADGKMMKAGALGRMGHGQGLHLSITSPDSRIIASVVVNVRGWSHAAVETMSGDSAQAVRAEAVRFPGAQGRTASADVWVPGLNSVTSIDLTSVTFTNGSTWQPAARGACSTAPDPFMLISK